MDIVFIRDLRVTTTVGVYAWERSIRQTLTLDLEMATDIRAAAASDDLAHTLNYHAVATRVSAFVAASQYQLIEPLAEGIAALIRAEFGVSWLRLTLGKPGAVPAAACVGLIIERGERG